VYKPKRPPDRRYPEKERKKRKEKRKKEYNSGQGPCISTNACNTCWDEVDAEGNKGTKLGTRRDKACELQVANCAGGLNGKMA
jgi:hypothetical protein